MKKDTEFVLFWPNVLFIMKKVILFWLNDDPKHFSSSATDGPLAGTRKYFSVVIKSGFITNKKFWSSLPLSWEPVFRTKSNS